MGVDVQIAFRSIDGLEPEMESPLPPGYSVIAARGWSAPILATHEVETYARYYGPGHERGPWPQICAVLLLLHACESVDVVWYGGDNMETLPECSRSQVLEISAHYMKYGERPYRDAFIAT